VPAPETVQPTSIGYRIVQLCRAHRAAVGSRLAQLGLHPGQEVILMHLWREDGQSQKQLAARLGVQPPTVTKMLQRLESSGIVERRASNTDGRSVNAFLTRRGRDLEPQVQAIWAQMDDRTAAHLGGQELEVFETVLGKILVNLRESGAQDEEC
jgi:DNA-binding MarR family transcriptional regulator